MALFTLYLVGAAIASVRPEFLFRSERPPSVRRYRRRHATACFCFWESELGLTPLHLADALGRPVLLLELLAMPHADRTGCGRMGMLGDNLRAHRHLRPLCGR